MELFSGLVGAHTREKMFEAAESMTTSKGRPVRGGWSDGNYRLRVGFDRRQHP